MTKQLAFGSSLLLILVLVLSCAPPVGDATTPGEQKEECADCWDYNPLDHHTNPPIILGKGNSPPSWHRKRKGLNKRHKPDNGVKVFQDGTCRSNLGVLNYGLVGMGTSSLYAERSNGQLIKNWSEKPFQITGNGYTLTMLFGPMANEFTLSYGGESCTLEAANANWNSHEKIPSEFGELDGATIVYDPSGANWGMEKLEITTYDQ